MILKILFVYRKMFIMIVEVHHWTKISFLKGLSCEKKVLLYIGLYKGHILLIKLCYYYCSWIHHYLSLWLYPLKMFLRIYCQYPWFISMLLELIMMGLKTTNVSGDMKVRIKNSTCIEVFNLYGTSGLFKRWLIWLKCPIFYKHVRIFWIALNAY